MNTQSKRPNQGNGDGSTVTSTNRFKFSITGKAAHGRLKPLLPQHWIDCSPYNKSSASGECYEEENSNNKDKLHFIWENAPRSETKNYRNDALCYSHLPNGIEILDDKWVLGRIFSYNADSLKAEKDPNALNDVDPYFVALETHCFRGRSGLESFCNRMRSRPQSSNAVRKTSSKSSPAHTSNGVAASGRTKSILTDLDPKFNTPLKQKEVLQPDNIWVIKDANSNGFGGIWIMDVNSEHSNPSSLSPHMLLDTEKSPLKENHRYVAQKYSWPPVLYQGRKCHIRVYVVIMNGRAYVHRRCFLHVANEQFQCRTSTGNDCDEGNFSENFDPAVHITNCCANSHDSLKFAGEVVADFDRTDAQAEDQRSPDIKAVPLHKYFPSVAASVKSLAEKTAPFIQGGEKNGGFEYLGLDFILSHKRDAENNDRKIPIAFLLEVNCPPSQDTATGLDHAENLHNEVLGDLLKMWVIPNVEYGLSQPKETFGWKCVYESGSHETKGEDLIQPSKAIILNKIRWGIFERRMKKLNENEDGHAHKKSESSANASILAHTQDLTGFAQSQFPFFNGDDTSQAESKSRIFLESAGGSQVPIQVINSMTKSLSHRHRSIIGQKSKDEARIVAITLLGGTHSHHKVFFGENASSMFDRLARRCLQSGFLSEGDEVVLASENHLANVHPWVDAAGEAGAKVVWWTRKHPSNKFLGEKNFTFSTDFHKLLTEKTRIVCLSHSSNILGSTRDIETLCKEVREKCPRAHFVVDGVAAAPHMYPAVHKLGVDWYCVSCHKLFGPHLGVMVGRNDALNALLTKSEEEEIDPYRLLESGTINYEACNGIIGLGAYFTALATFQRGSLSKDVTSHSSQTGEDPMEAPKLPLAACSIGGKVLSEDIVKEAYRRINLVEKDCIEYVIESLKNCEFVQVIGENQNLPLISFVHLRYSPKSIVDWCSLHQIDVRCGSFMTTKLIQNEYNFSSVVRISFCHYNDLSDAQQLMATLESIPGWDK